MTTLVTHLRIGVLSIPLLGAPVSDLHSVRLAGDLQGVRPTPPAKPEVSVQPSSADWCEVLVAVPDPTVVTDAGARARMIATGLPWKVRDRKSGIVMLLCPPGEFTMGSPESESGRGDDEPQHRRAIRKAFYLSETEVTQDEWQRAMDSNPSTFKGADRPVETVSWGDCRRFCESMGLRLPSEAEWEYACRAGTRGGHAGDLKELAWFGDNSGRSSVDADALWRSDKAAYLGKLRANGGETHPVRQRKANPWGLHDMHGNVWEWVEDAYGEYPKGVGTDEPVRSADAKSRVVRGGGWSDRASGCRSATRDGDAHGLRDDRVGFRVARSPD